MMQYIALWSGKITLVLLQLLHRRGAALPGLVVEKLYPRFMERSLVGLNQGVIVISGTNGKTTTTKLITAIAEKKWRVLTNPTGSNYTRGIVASIVAETTWSGRLAKDIAVLELDEAYAVHFVKRVQPRMVVLLNVMRDQMDRFAEIDHTARLLEKVAERATECVIYNTDDQRVSRIGEKARVRTVTFGSSRQMRSAFVYDDDMHGKDVLRTKKAIKQADFTLESFQDNTVEISHNGTSISGKVQLEGAHNASNITAALATASVLGVDLATSIKALDSVEPAFGRGEHIYIDGKKIILQLVKNPGGFRYVLHDAPMIQPDAVMIAINDAYADGRDVSWLWDVEYGDIRNVPYITTSGSRAADMALRLAYDQIETQDINEALPSALKHIIASVQPGQTAMVFATYTAMLALRKQLSAVTEVQKV